MHSLTVNQREARSQNLGASTAVKVGRGGGSVGNWTLFARIQTIHLPPSTCAYLQIQAVVGGHNLLPIILIL